MTDTQKIRIENAVATPKSEDGILTGVLLEIGRGNPADACFLFGGLANRILEAREKHPAFAKNQKEAKGVIMAEVAELCLAIDQESRERQINEALDVMATCARFILGEHLPGDDHERPEI